MKKLYFIASLASMLAFSSCQKENLTPEPSLATNKGAREGIVTPLAWTEFGPFSVAGNFSQIRSKVLVFITGQPGIPAGNYVCDVFQNSLEFNLAGNQIMASKSASLVGYANYTNQSIQDFAYVEVNNPNGTKKQTFNTYSIKILYSVTGVPINVVIPRDISNVTYTYTYLQNI